MTRSQDYILVGFQSSLCLNTHHRVIVPLKYTAAFLQQRKHSTSSPVHFSITGPHRYRQVNRQFPGQPEFGVKCPIVWCRLCGSQSLFSFNGQLPSPLPFYPHGHPHSCPTQNPGLALPKTGLGSNRYSLSCLHRRSDLSSIPSTTRHPRTI